MTALEAALAVILLATIWALVRVTRDQANPVSLLQLVVDPASGRMSLGRTGQLVALIVSSWAFVWLVIADRLTEWYYGTYMLAWAGAHLAAQALKRGQAGEGAADAPR